MALVIRRLVIVFAVLGLFTSGASAEKQYGPGVSDTEIKIGNIMPYSGPASAYGIVGKTMSAYFRMINDNGGINGRRITFISYGDAYSPAKTVEQARKLVESRYGKQKRRQPIAFGHLSTASVAGDLPDVSRAIRTAPREAARTRRACGIRTP